MKKEKEVNAVENRIKETEAAKHTIKDSVFTNLFQEKSICSSYIKPCIRRIQR